MHHSGYLSHPWMDFQLVSFVWQALTNERVRPVFKWIEGRQQEKKTAKQNSSGTHLFLEDKFQQAERRIKKILILLCICLKKLARDFHISVSMKSCRGFFQKSIFLLAFHQLWWHISLRQKRNTKSLANFFETCFSKTPVTSEGGPQIAGWDQPLQMGHLCTTVKLAYNEPPRGVEKRSL